MVQREIRFIQYNEMLKYRHDLTQHGLQFSLPFCQNFSILLLPFLTFLSSLRRCKTSRNQHWCVFVCQ